MSRYRRVLPLVLLPGLASVVAWGGDSGPGGAGLRADRRIVAVPVSRPPSQAREAAEHKAARPIVWMHDPDEAPPVGLIPTEWAVRPHLLPNTWDVQTLPAAARGRADQSTIQNTADEVRRSATWIRLAGSDRAEANSQ